mgnify:CR=1 FL=1
MPSTPDSDSAPPRRLSENRRTVLAGLGTALTAGLAGCSGRIPGTGPETVDAETTVEDDRVLWRYPRRDGDQEGIGYAAVTADRLLHRERLPPTLRLEFNSTVGGLAASDPYRGFHPDWFRFRIRPPGDYAARLQYAVRVEPPGQWEGFGASYDIQTGVREFSVELRDVDTQGTILIPAVFDPVIDDLPRQLHCSFTVQASRPGVFGETVRVRDSATLPLDSVQNE